MRAFDDDLSRAARAQACEQCTETGTISNRIGPVYGGIVKFSDELEPGAPGVGGHRLALALL